MGKLFCLFIYQDKIKNMEDKFFKSFSGWTSVLRIGRYCAPNGTKWGLTYFKKFSTTEIISYVMQMYSGLHQYYRRQHFINTWPSGGVENLCLWPRFSISPSGLCKCKIVSNCDMSPSYRHFYCRFESVAADDCWLS